MVPTPHQAHFMRSRYSVDQQLVDAAMGRVMKWSRERGIAVNAKAPYPSNRPGKVWLEFRFGGFRCSHSLCLLYLGGTGLMLASPAPLFICHCVISGSYNSWDNAGYLYGTPIAFLGLMEEHILSFPLWASHLNRSNNVATRFLTSCIYPNGRSACWKTTLLHLHSVTTIIDVRAIHHKLLLIVIPRTFKIEGSVTSYMDI